MDDYRRYSSKRPVMSYLRNSTVEPYYKIPVPSFEIPFSHLSLSLPLSVSYTSMVYFDSFFICRVRLNELTLEVRFFFFFFQNAPL